MLPSLTVGLLTQSPNSMPVRTRKDLEQSLKQGQIEPVYFLYGSEVYLRDQAIRLITDTALTGTLLRSTILHSIC